jgi:hypothetical protein
MFLQGPRFIMIQRKLIADKNRYARINLREQMTFRRVKRVVEIENPVFDMGKISHGECRLTALAAR